MAVHRKRYGKSLKGAASDGCHHRK